MIVWNISPLICSSAQVLRIFNVKHLSYLCKSINKDWNSAEEFVGTHSQPDYLIEFEWSVFTQEQLNKLKSFVRESEFKFITHFMTTTQMYFPFLICEVKCDTAAFDIADYQNAHSMTVAVRTLVELFRLMKHEKELNQKILAFSISHNHKSMRIYSHYSVIEKDKTTFYCYSIHTFDFTALNKKERWTVYKFIKNVYDHHSLKFHELICSGIDDLSADINFDLSQFFSQSTPQNSQQSNTESALSEHDSQLSFLSLQEVTSITSFTQTLKSAFKKLRNEQAGSGTDVWLWHLI